MKTGTCKNCGGETKTKETSRSILVMSCASCPHWELEIPTTKNYTLLPYSSEMQGDKPIVNFLT